ncbi:hypothetical protein Syun_014901 [Stephania yunnanensis]|uniref:Uncharacterized protein n=1 Tax=Stephania yunnanensis TaxID=152371 RepID=A0AAP0JL98_9MAGN
MVDHLLLRDSGGDELRFLLCSCSSPSRTHLCLAVRDGAGFLLLTSSSPSPATNRSRLLDFFRRRCNARWWKRSEMCDSTKRTKRMCDSVKMENCVIR